MKIQGKTSEAHKLTINTQQAQDVGRKGNVTASQRQKQVDRVEISQRGRDVASITLTINSLPDVREEKVQALKESVNAGTYKVDPIKVAEKMLSEI